MDIMHGSTDQHGGVMEYLYYLAGFVAVLYAITFFTFVAAILAARLRPGDCELKERCELPPHLTGIFEYYGRRLERLGFEFSHLQLVQYPFVNDYSRRWYCVHTNAERGVHAFVYPSDFPERLNSCEIEFTTIAFDGSRISTVNGIFHRIIGGIPRTRIIDPYAETLEQHWAAHLKALEKERPGMKPLIMGPEASVEHFREISQRYITSLVEKGWIEARDEGDYAMRIIPALMMAYRMTDGEVKAASLRNKRLKSAAAAENPPEAPLELEVECYNRLASSTSSRKPGGWASKLLLLLGSLLFFTLSFHYVMSFERLIILIVVLFIHELGHLLGMYIFKYRDLKILFLPFLGAAAIGSQRGAKPYQRIIVSLMGPVPGIFLGFMLFAACPSQGGPWREAAFMLIVLNYLNLLPVMPLDGGQLFNLFMARFPYFQVIFQILSAIFFVFVFGILLKAPVMLAIGIFLLISALAGLPQCALLVKLRERLKMYGVEVKDEDIIREIFNLFRSKPYDSLAFARKYQIARSIVSTFAIELPSAWLVIGTFIIYLALFVVPIIGYLCFLILRHFR
jgi:Zn-dependent protease